PLITGRLTPSKASTAAPPGPTDPPPSPFASPFPPPPPGFAPPPPSGVRPGPGAAPSPSCGVVAPGVAALLASSFLSLPPRVTAPGTTAPISTSTATTATTTARRRRGLPPPASTSGCGWPIGGPGYTGPVPAGTGEVRVYSVQVVPSHQRSMAGPLPVCPGS